MLAAVIACVVRGGNRGAAIKHLLDAVDLETSARAAFLESIEYFAGFLDFSDLKIEHTEGGISSAPLGKQVDCFLELVAASAVLPRMAEASPVPRRSFLKPGMRACPWARICWAASISWPRKSINASDR